MFDFVAVPFIDNFSLLLLRATFQCALLPSNQSDFELLMTLAIWKKRIIIELVISVLVFSDENFVEYCNVITTYAE